MTFASALKTFAIALPRTAPAVTLAAPPPSSSQPSPQPPPSLSLASLSPTAMRLLSSWLIFACQPLCVASEPFTFKPFTMDAAENPLVDHTPSIDHLLPAGVALPEFDYVAQFLVPPDTYPDRDGFSVVILKTDDDRYVLQTAVLPRGGGLATRQKPKSAIQISKSLADVVYQIRVNTILETRYDRQSYAGLDGTTYFFSTFVSSLGWMHGRVWEPHADLPPRWIVEAGEQLSEFARDPKRDPKKTEAAMLATRDKLFKYLKENGKH